MKYHVEITYCLLALFSRSDKTKNVMFFGLVEIRHKMLRLITTGPLKATMMPICDPQSK